MAPGVDAAICSRSTSGRAAPTACGSRGSRAAGLVRRLDGDPAVEAARAEERRVEDLGTIRRREHDHVRAGLEPVHLRQDLVQRLLALVVTAADAADAASAGASDRVELVDEDDRGSALLRLLEQVAHARGADADDRLDELGGGQREERRVRLARDRACEERLARPGRAVEEHAAGNAGAEPAVALRVLEEVDDLDELLLRLVDAGDVVERDALLPAPLEAAGGRPAEAAEDAARPAWRRDSQTKNPTRRSAGASPSRRLSRKLRPASGALALMTTSLSVSSFVSPARSMNAGTCVLNRSTSTGLSSPGGSYVVGFFSSPSIESSREVIASTFPASTCSRKNGWYGTRGRSGGAPVRNEITRLRASSPTKNTSNALLRGNIGGFEGCLPRPSGAGSTRQPCGRSGASGGSRGEVGAELGRESPKPRATGFVPGLKGGKIQRLQRVGDAVVTPPRDTAGRGWSNEGEDGDARLARLVGGRRRVARSDHRLRRRLLRRPADPRRSGRRRDLNGRPLVARAPRGCCRSEAVTPE